MSLDHESRSQGIGGSEIATICGVSPYGSQVEVWLAKKHGIREPKTGHHLERGIHLEAGMIGWYEERIRRELGDRSATVIVDTENFAHPRHPICRATPDGLLVTEDSASGDEMMAGPPSDWADRVVEVKLPGSYTWRDWGPPGTDEIPHYYLPQVTWEMGATGVNRCDVVALVDDDLAIYHVRWNPDLFAELLRRAESWWDRYVVGDGEPPADGSKAYKDWLAKTYPRPVREDLDVAGDRVETLIQEYLDARKDEKAAAARKAIASAALCREIGDGVGFQGASGRARWSVRKGRTTLDTEAMRADGINVDKYQQPGSEYRTLGVWEAK